MTTLFVVIGFIFIIETIVIVILGHVCRDLQENNLELEKQLVDQKKQIVALMKYADESGKIKDDKNDNSQKIQGAQTDEEVSSIVSNIVNSNNNRVRKSSKGKDNATGKA